MSGMASMGGTSPEVCEVDAASDDEDGVRRGVGVAEPGRSWYERRCSAEGEGDGTTSSGCMDGRSVTRIMRRVAASIDAHNTDQ